MRSIHCVVTLFAVLIYAEASNRNVIIQHRKTGNFIAWYNGVSGTPVTFTPNDINAQTFQVVMNDNGYFWFITSDGSSLLSKKGGCGGANYYVYDTDGNGDNKLFTLNNDYSIGSKCCNTCLLIPRTDNMLIEMGKFSCLTSKLSDYQFDIIPVDY